MKRDIRSIGLQKAAEWRFAMIIGHAGAWPITIGPDDGPGLRYQRRKTASARCLPALTRPAQVVIGADGDRPGPGMANDHGELPFGGFLQPNRPNIPLQAGKPHYAEV